MSDKEFEEKYWLNGVAPYQFHTMDISDGVDERQQLLINNDRALYNKMEFVKAYGISGREDLYKMIRKQKSAITVCMVMAAISLIIAIYNLFT